MPGAHLAVDHAKIPGLKLAGQGYQGEFRCIRDSREHGFAIEYAADGDAVQTSSKLSVHPCLYRVGVTCPMEFRIGGDHLFRDPGAALSAAGFLACRYDMRERAIGCDLERCGADGFSNRARQMQFCREQHHARIRTPPQNGVVFAEPGKDSLPIGIDKGLCGKIAPRGEKSIRIAQRPRQRGKIISGTKPGNHTANNVTCG